MKRAYLVVLPGILLALAGGAVAIFATSDPEAFLGFLENVDPDTFGIILGVGITVFVLLILALAFSSGIKGALENAKNRSILQERGVRTKAVILDVKDTGITVNDNPYVEITVETVRGSKATFKMLASRIQIPRPGDGIEVLYDPVNPTVAVNV